MAAWLDIKGAIVADTVYSGGKLVAKDVSFTLPGLTFQTGSIKAMGDMDIPLLGLLDSMEANITKIGIDRGLNALSRLEKQNLEFRWAQNVIKSDGSSSVEGCKAFIRGIPKTLPGIGVELGSASENELTYEVSRLQIYCAGKEYMLIDRLNQILRVDGKDYMSNISKLL